MTDISEAARKRAEELLRNIHADFEDEVCRYIQQVSDAAKVIVRDAGYFETKGGVYFEDILQAFILPEPVDPVQDCLREAYGAAAPEFVSAFKAALAKRGLELRKTQAEGR